MSWKPRIRCSENLLQLPYRHLRAGESAFPGEPADVIDYAAGIGGLPKTNMLKYKMPDGSWIAIRPSGTEPKLKIYCSLVADTEPAARQRFDAILARFEHLFFAGKHA